MRTQTEKAVAGQAPAEVRPIEFVTENGFSILRPWEFEQKSLPATRSFHFLVRYSQRQEQEVLVEISDDVLSQLSMRVLRRILACTSFWVCCAERHLATYLWEKDTFPLENKLVVNHLDPEEIILAMRWCRALAREKEKI